jgi:ATP-binding cassette subfamily B protein
VLVKLFGSDRRELAAFQKHAGGVRDAGVRQALYGRVFFVALGLVAAIGAVAIYGVGGHLVVSGTISTGTLVALAALVGRAYSPLTALTNARVDLMTSLVSFERVFEVLDAPEAIAERPGAIDLPALDRHGGRRVTFDTVRFRYPPAAETSVPSLEQRAPDADPDRDVLDGIDLDVAPGETIALVGTSGAGKSTLVSLIPRLYDVTSGAVLVDGHDVRDVAMASLRGAIGVVSQDPHLFHVSVGENLRYARPDATAAEVVVAAKAARIHDTIAALTDGYDTVVGERGYRLSGGEKQRIAIARLLLKDPEVVILDEATSHLDNDSEAQVQAALETALEGRTAIVIAHRLSTVRNADRIAVLDGGRIAEVGSHDELVERNGLYAAQLRAGGLFDIANESTPLRSPATPAIDDRASAGASSLASARSLLA